MRVLCTGQSGLDKADFLKKVVSIASKKGKSVRLFNIGEMMYDENGTVPPGKILNLDYYRLDYLCKSAFSKAITQAKNYQNAIINAHSTFRWNYGLFRAFDYKLIKRFKPDMFITLLNNVELIKYVLQQRTDPVSKRFSLKDIIVWREEEIMATEILSEAFAGKGRSIPHYIVPKMLTPHIMYQLMFESGKKKKVYSSFPISLILDKPAIAKKTKNFRKYLKKHFIVFDPYSITERDLLDVLEKARKERKKRVTIERKCGKKKIAVDVNVNELAEIEHDIDGQIISRDYKLIDQSDMVIAIIPDVNGKPSISSGVTRELQHAYQTGKETFVFCRLEKKLSPFECRNATQIFTSFRGGSKYFRENNYI